MKNEMDVIKTRVSQLEGSFRTLRKLVHRKYAEEYQLAKDFAFSPNSRTLDKRRQKTQKIIREAGLDQEKLQDLDNKAQAEAMEHLERGKEKLVNRKIDTDQYYRERLIKLSYFNRFGAANIPIIGADLIRFADLFPLRDADVIETDPNEWGDSIWFQPNNQIKVSVMQSGTNSDALVTGTGTTFLAGCFDGNIYGPRRKIDFWFLYDNPPHNCFYWILCNFYYNGFYRLYADDKIYNCRKVWAHVKANLEFYRNSDIWGQNIPIPFKSFPKTIFAKEASNINEVGTLSGSAEWDIHFPLEQGEAIWFVISLELFCKAKTLNDFAEINFEDGEANFIGSPILMVAC